MDDLRPTARPRSEETGRHLDHLDGWRGAAILTVLCGHFGVDGLVGGVSTLGVDLFFALSGRLMAEILVVQRADLRTFFVRRFSRIYPALLAYVVCTGVAFHHSAYRHGAVAAASALTFTLNYAMTYGHPVALLDHLWSLCVEEQSYFVLAVLAAAARRRSDVASAWFGALGFAALANGIVQTYGLDRPYFQVFWRTDVQAAGLLLSAALFLARDRLPLLGSPWAFPASFALALAAKILGTGVVVRFGIGSVLLAIAVTSCDATFDAVLRCMRWRPLRIFGVLSYSLYLWQQPFYKMYRDALGSIPALLLLALVSALASFSLIERPARAALNGAWSRRSPSRGRR